MGIPSDGVGITSWATSNDLMLANLMRLYARPGQVVVDPTWGKGTFWRAIETGLYDFRATDILTGVDCRSLPYDDGSVDVVVYDPPYRYVEARTQAITALEDSYNLSSLSESRAGIDGVVDLYRDGMREGARVLQKGGYLMVKCQDTAGDGRQFWMHVTVMNLCAQFGLTPVDLAVVVTERPPPTRWRVQRSLKKAHSYFVVARKGGYYPFGYKSVQAR